MEKKLKPPPVTAIDTLTNLTGLCALTADGKIGEYREDKTLGVNQALSAAFATHNRQFLQAYRAAADASGYRLGLLYHSRQRRPWGTDTFVLEEAVVRDVYPVSGQSFTAELTTFQKKNREKSIYRGIELLLDFRDGNVPDAAVYCPLVYDRGTTLDCYPTLSNAVDAGTPVLEVLNLLAPVPMARRQTDAISTLVQNIRRLVHKEKHSPRFELLSDVDWAAEEGGGFFDVDSRADRAVTLSGADLQRRLLSAEALQASQRLEEIERWLAVPPQPVDPARLRQFAQFRDLPPDRAALLTYRALVYSAPGGTRLLHRRMTDAWNLYLLDGTVSLEAEDGGSLFIEGATEKAASPVAFLKPRKYTVTAVTGVKFLWIHDAVLQAVLSKS
jgi:hypothetical protein